MFYTHTHTDITVTVLQQRENTFERKQSCNSGGNFKRTFSWIACFSPRMVPAQNTRGKHSRTGIVNINTKKKVTQKKLAQSWDAWNGKIPTEHSIITIVYVDSGHVQRRPLSTDGVNVRASECDECFHTLHRAMLCDCERKISVYTDITVTAFLHSCIIVRTVLMRRLLQGKDKRFHPMRLHNF